MHAHPHIQNLNQARRRRAQQQKAEELLDLPVDELFRRGDHINQYGLPNDGYDYSSHFKEMGSGKFVSASGRVADPGIQARRIELPEEVLPGQDMDRMLEHITISESGWNTQTHQGECCGGRGLTTAFVVTNAQTAWTRISMKLCSRAMTRRRVKDALRSCSTTLLCRCALSP
jgi:hypothetical protein